MKKRVKKFLPAFLSVHRKKINLYKVYNTSDTKKKQKKINLFEKIFQFKFIKCYKIFLYFVLCVKLVCVVVGFKKY